MAKETQDTGRIGKPTALAGRWPRATTCLGLSALIACAGCAQEPVRRLACRDNLTNEQFEFMSDRQEAGRRSLRIEDVDGNVRVWTGTSNLTCKRA